MIWWITLPPLLLIALLAIPFEAVVDFRRDPRWRGSVRVRWLYGLVRLRLPGKPRQPKGPKAPAIMKKERIVRPARALRRVLRVARRVVRVVRPSPRRIWRAISRARFRRAVFRLVTGLAGCIRFRETSLHLWIGLDDPADMGMLCAWLVPLISILRRQTAADLLLFPDFEEDRFEAAGHGAVRLIPLEPILVVLRFVLSPSAWQAGWTVMIPSKA